MTWRLVALLCSIEVLGIYGATAQGEESPKAAGSNEQFERDVDEVALASQEKAISRVNTLLKKYAGTHQEPILLSKLAELEQQTGAILFRIGHGEAHSRGKALDLTKYHRAMRQSVKTLTTLISKYPSFEEIPQAYYMRGKALEEVGSKQLAAEDYTFLAGHYPDSESVSSAYMSLAEFAIEANEHAKAIGYLNHVEGKPEDPHYPFALYKLAWSHYNLKQIDKALSYAERQVAYYDARKKDDAPEAENVVTSDSALRENTLMDITTFYLDGYEAGTERYNLDESFAYFKKLEKGPLLGRMLHRYAKLLRSHGHEADLVRWKDIVLKNENERPELLDVVLTVYENQLNKRRYAQLVDTAQDFVRLYPNLKKLPDFPKAQKMILDTAEGLQLLIVKNKGAKEVGDLSKILAQVYDAFTRVVEESDPRIPRVHYNLAETLFTIKDYDTATRHYRWVVEHGSWNSSGKDVSKKAVNSLDPDAPFATVPDASLKAIASRYEVLRARKLIPNELVAKGEKESTDKEFDPILAEWVHWIDTHVDHTFDDMDNFYFEGNRVLYVQGHVAQATERLKKFAFKHSKSTYAIPSASLVIDTYIAGKEWKRTYELANDLMDVREWKGSEFGKRLFSVAADSFYKQIEVLYNAHEYKNVIGECDDFLRKYATSTRLADTLSLAGNSAMNVGEREKALTYFSRLIAETPKSGNVGNALLARAQLEEDRYDFPAASSDYRSYLSLPMGQLTKGSTQQLDNLRRKALVLSWISGEPEKLRLALESKVICGEGSNVASDCARYQLLGRVLDVIRRQPGGLDEKQTEEAFDAARRATGDMRTLYAALALEGLPHLAFRDRNHVARWASSGWGELEPIVKFSLLPALTASLPKSFAMNRAAMKEVAPLRADEKYITRRVEVIREMENAATEVMKLPWARIRAEVLSELASLYLDLSHGLSTLPPPKGLSTEDLAQYDAVIHKLILPFEEKGQDMRGKAFEIASRAAIEEDAFHKIADPFFQENPSQAKALKPVSEIAVPAVVDLSLLTKLDPSGAWKVPAKLAPSKLEDPVTRFKAAWMVAVQSRSWPQVAFFMNEAQEKALIPAGVMGVVKAVSLAAAGARGEALAELEESKKDLNPIARNIVITTLLQYSLRACSREHTLALLKDVQPDSLSRDQAALVAHATTYASEQSKKR